MAELYFDTRNPNDPVRWWQRASFMYAVRKVAPEIFKELETKVYEPFKRSVVIDLWKISLYSHPMAPVYELERRIAGIIDPALDDTFPRPLRRTSDGTLAHVPLTWADDPAYFRRNRALAQAYQEFLEQLTEWLEAHNLATHEWMIAFIIDTLHIWNKSEAALEKHACANFLRNSSALGNIYLYGLHFNYRKHLKHVVPIERIKPIWTFLPLLPNPQSRLGKVIHQLRKRAPWIIQLAPRLPLKTPRPLPMSPYEYDYGYTWYAVHCCKNIARRWGFLFGVLTAKDARVWLKYMREISERHYKVRLKRIKQREWPKDYEQFVTRERTYSLHTKMQWFAYSVVHRYTPDEVSTKFPQLQVPENEAVKADLPTSTVRDATKLMSKLTGVARPKAKRRRQTSKLPSNHVLRRCQDKLREHLESNSWASSLEVEGLDLSG